MYTRITTVHVLPDRMEKLLRLYEETLLPGARAQQGFRGSLLLRDPDEDKVLLVTWWETREDLLANEASGYYQQKMAQLADLAASVTVVKHYDTPRGT